MPKFFVPDGNISESSIRITGDDVNHIARVHRSKPGDVLLVCDGKGTDYECEIKSVGKEEILLDIIKQFPCEAEPDVKITLFQCLPKQGKMETIIQKTTELGITRIVPVTSHRCVVKADKNDNKKLERWRKVALEAAKQCGRGAVPVIDSIMTFDQAVKAASELQYAIIPYEEEHENRLSSALASDIKEIGIIVGPEGGFEPGEVEKAIKNGIKSVTLGKRILRTETVGSALVPVIMFKMNNM